MDNFKTKSCSNCRWYNQHYVKRFTEFHAVCCGRCKKKRCGQWDKRPDEVCELWEDIAELKQERKAHICNTLQEINERLKGIAAILKSDEKN